MYHDLVNQMLEMLQDFNKQEVTEFPAFKARGHLRNKLIELGIAPDLANRATAALDISIPVEFNEDDELMDGIFKIADEMAILIVKFHTATMKDFGPSDEIFLKLLDGAHIKIE